MLVDGQAADWWTLEERFRCKTQYDVAFDTRLPDDNDPEDILDIERREEDKRKPLWMRQPENVANEEYIAFYRSLSEDRENPLAMAHFSIEGQLGMRAVIYVPRSVPFNVFVTDRIKKGNIELFAGGAPLASGFES